MACGPHHPSAGTPWLFGPVRPRDADDACVSRIARRGACARGHPRRRPARHRRCPDWSRGRGAGVGCRLRRRRSPRERDRKRRDRGTGAPRGAQRGVRR